MPTYRVTAPDGRVYRVTGDGTADDALAHIQANYTESRPADRPQSDPVDPSAGGGTLSFGPIDTGIQTPQAVDRFLSGAGKAITDIGRGAGQLLGVVDTADVAESRRLDAPLAATTAGKVGQVVGGIATAAPAALVPGANTVAGAGLIGAGYGLLQPAESVKERAVNTAVGGTVGAASQAIGQKIATFAASRLGARAANRAAVAEQNSVRAATLAEARKAGYVVPPSQTNPTAANRVLESVSGKAATEQAAMAKNQAVTNRLARKSLGLESNAPLTRNTLNALRRRAGKVYEAIKDAGDVVADSQYLDDLADISKSIDDVARDFPDANVGANEEISRLVDSMLRDRFKAGSALEYTKQLRNSAKGNLSGVNAADPSKRALGFAQRDAAAALEDAVIRHLRATGKSGLADQFDKARVLIAKTHSVEGALNDSTGNVIASQLARDLKRGKPLSGELETVARFAQAFPASAREAQRSAGISAVDALVAGGGLAVGQPATVAIPLSRYATRATILSEPFQRNFTAPVATGKAGDRALRLFLEGGRRAAIPASVVGVNSLE